MKKYFYEAKSYEDAKNKALAELKIDEELTKENFSGIFNSGTFVWDASGNAGHGGYQLWKYDTSYYHHNGSARSEYHPTIHNQ